MSLRPRKEEKSKSRSFRKKSVEPEGNQRVVLNNPELFAQNLADAKRKVDALQVQIDHERRPNRRAKLKAGFKEAQRAVAKARVHIQVYRESKKKDEATPSDMQPIAHHQQLSHQAFMKPQPAAQKQDEITFDMTKEAVNQIIKLILGK